MALDRIRLSIRKTGAEHDLYLKLCQAYGGRPTITLAEFLRDFVSGNNGNPMKRKTAMNRVYKRDFPVPVTCGHVLLSDIASWLHHERTKH